MNEIELNPDFIKANMQVDIFNEKLGEFIYLEKIEKRNENILLVILVIGAVLTFTSVCIRARNEKENNASKFKHNQ